MQLSHYFLRNAGLVGGVSTEIHLGRNMVMLHIKLKRITNAATW